MTKNHNSTTISISLSSELLNDMNKYVIHTSNQKKRLTVSLTPFQYKFYKSIEKGNRSHVFSILIREYIDILEKEQIGKIFQSKNELVRNVLNHTQIFKKIGNKLSLNRIPNVKSPLGNIYHIKGNWRKFHSKQKIIQYDENCSRL